MNFIVIRNKQRTSNLTDGTCCYNSRAYIQIPSFHKQREYEGDAGGKLVYAYTEMCSLE